MALAIVAGHCWGKRVRSSFETYAAQRGNEGKWAPTLHSERKTGDLFYNMLIESGVRRIWTLQSEESPAETKTDDPGLNPCHLTEGVHNCWKGKGRPYTIQSMILPNIFIKRSEYRLDSGHWKTKTKKYKKIICPRGEFRKRSQLGNFQLHRQSPTGHIKM